MASRTTGPILSRFKDEIVALNDEGKTKVQNVIRNRALMGSACIGGGALAAVLAYRYLPKYQKAGAVAAFFLASIILTTPVRSYEMNSLKAITQNPSFKNI